MTISLCHADDIPEGGARGFDLPQGKVFALRKDDSIYVYLNRCPHLHLPLEWEQDAFLDEQGEHIRCSNHGAVFLPESGECIMGPCQGDSLWSIEYRLEEGLVIIPEEELPEFPGPA